MSECLNIWKRVSVELRATLDSDTWERYLAGIIPVSVDHDECLLTLGVSNEFIALWLENNYREIVEEGVRRTADADFRIRFVSGYDAPKVAIAAEKAEFPLQIPHAVDVVPRDRQERTMKLNLRPDFTFDNFITGDSNRICEAAAEAVAATPGNAYNPLFIYGGSGLGKTHLLQAIANRMAAEDPSAKIEYLTSEEFLNLFTESIRNNASEEFRKRFRSADLLLIDDVQFFKGKDGTANEFFHTFNSLYNAHKQVVIAADRTPHELELDNRLISRFDSGFSAEIVPPDFATRLAILRKKQEKQAVKLDDKILNLIAGRISSNIRSLEGALTILTMNISALGCDMTLELAEQLLRNKFDAVLRKSVCIDNIQKYVADQFDLKISDIIGKKRPRNIADARMVAMYLSRKLTKHSYPVIGEAFNRNHATILHAYERIGERIAKDDGFRMTIEALERQIKG